MNEYEGKWISTLRVPKFHFLNPQKHEILIEDIAHALAMTCRFGGHIDRFYSVAEHSVRASWLAPRYLRLVALLHDAEEAYVPDVPRPIKMELPQVQELYKPLNKAIMDKYEVGAYDELEMKEIDDRLCITEAQAMGVWREDWAVLGEPYAIPSSSFGWTWQESEQRFLYEFNKIKTGGYNGWASPI